MKVVVVDDEDPARRRLVRILSRIPDVVVVGEARNVHEARIRLREHEPDVLLLDIQMPEISGLHFVAEASPVSQVIFTTAHSDYAVRAFEIGVVDYILKPVTLERLTLALDRARAGAVHSSGRAPAARARPLVCVRRGGSQRYFEADTVTRFYAADKYTLFSAGAEEQVLSESLCALEARLAKCGFMRVHRSELINLRAVRGVVRKGNATYVELCDGQRALVSRRSIALLKSRLSSLVNPLSSP